MADYDYLDLMNAMRDAGFRSGAGLVTGFAVSLGENTSRNLRAVGTNPDGSRDRGPWQINDRWHPEVSDACAFDLACSTGEAYRLSSQGSSWSAWSAYTNGRYKQFLDIGYLAYSASKALEDKATFKSLLDSANAKLGETQEDLDAARQQVLSLTDALAIATRKISNAKAALG